MWAGTRSPSPGFLMLFLQSLETHATELMSRSTTCEYWGQRGPSRGNVCAALWKLCEMGHIHPKCEVAGIFDLFGEAAEDIFNVEHLFLSLSHGKRNKLLGTLERCTNRMKQAGAMST